MTSLVYLPSLSHDKDETHKVSQDEKMRVCNSKKTHISPFVAFPFAGEMQNKWKLEMFIFQRKIATAILHYS